ncbi:MAG: FecR domain-containing protein [Fibrobacterota bacterium]|nr:FecR domain-containing protein [Fibrobacterota bacterium]QQS07301.1 MAG: FecR domain-containing protein [Fibrobacterota bacterium]
MLASITLCFAILAAAPAKTGKHSASSHSTRSAPAVARDTTTAEPDSLFSQVIVGPSQTLSWIGLRSFGAWTPEIASQVIRDNPQLRSSALTPGQTLRLRKGLDRRSLSPAQQITMASRRAVVTRLSGTAQRIRTNGIITPLQADEFVQAGERIQTGPQSMVELIIDNQSILRVRSNSQLDLVYLQDSTKLRSNQAGTQVRLGFGRVWTKVRKWAGPLVGFEVRMPMGIAGVHGTIFECQVNADSSSQVWVEEGVVGVRGSGKDTSETPVTRGQSVAVDATGQVERVTEPPLLDPMDLLPDPSPDVRNNNRDDLRATIQQAVAQRQAMSETAASPPKKPSKADVIPRKQR